VTARGGGAGISAREGAAGVVPLADADGASTLFGPMEKINPLPLSPKGLRMSSGISMRF